MMPFKLDKAKLTIGMTWCLFETKTDYVLMFFSQLTRDVMMQRRELLEKQFLYFS